MDGFSLLQHHSPHVGEDGPIENPLMGVGVEGETVTGFHHLVPPFEKPPQHPEMTPNHHDMVDLLDVF